MAVQRLRFTFPTDLIKEPVIYLIGQKFEVITNIRMADVDEHTGWVILELEGRCRRDRAQRHLGREPWCACGPHHRRRRRRLATRRNGDHHLAATVLIPQPLRPLTGDLATVDGRDRHALGLHSRP